MFRGDLKKPLEFEPKDVITDPFPFFFRRNAIAPDLFAELVADWPDDSFFEGIAFKMGKRQGFTQHKPAFETLIARSTAWNRFFSYVNSPDFVHQAVTAFVPDFSLLGCRVSPKTLTFCDNVKKLSPEQLASNQYVTLDFEITRATTGYLRTPHSDSPHRLMAFLIFLNDASEYGGSGGAFAIHRHKQLPMLFENNPPEAFQHSGIRSLEFT